MSQQFRPSNQRTNSAQNTSISGNKSQYTSGVVKSGRVQVFQDNPVYHEREVEVPYEVVIDRPIENIIENRYYVDKYVEIPVTHVTEIEVEVIKEVKKYINIERKVDVETIYEKPYEKIIEVPIEIIREIPVPVERIVNKTQERTILRPHRVEVVDKPVYVDKEYKVDKIVEKYVDVDVPVYFDKVYDKVVDVPEYVYRDVIMEVQKFQDVPRDVYYDRIVDVPKERIVEKEVVVDRIVEKPYTVERIVEKRREVPVERIVEVPVYFDKIVEVPVERRVEVPYKVQRHVKKIVPKQVNVPMITTKDVEIPFERIIEEPYEVIEEIPVPYEKVVERTVDVPVYHEEQVFDYIEIEVPYERIVEVPVYKDIEIEVEIIRETFVEVPFERIVERIVEIEKIIEKPIYNQKIVEIPIQKIVERRVEVPIEKYVEIPKYREVQKHIRVEKKSQRSVVVEKKNSRSLRKSVKTSTISASQKNAYTSLGEGLSKYKIENLKLSLDLKALQTQIVDYRKIAQNPEVIRSQNEELRKKIATYESSIISIKSQNVSLEQSTATTKEVQIIEAYSQAEISKLENEVRLLVEKNKKLSGILQTLGDSTQVTNTFYVQKTMNEISKINTTQNSRNDQSVQGQNSFVVTQSTYGQTPVINVQQPRVEYGASQAKISYSNSQIGVEGNNSYTRIVDSKGLNVNQVGNANQVRLSQDARVALNRNESADRRVVNTTYNTSSNKLEHAKTGTSEVRVVSESSQRVLNTQNDQNLGTHVVTTNFNMENVPMHTVYTSTYDNAKSLDSYPVIGRKSQTHTIVGEPTIKPSITQFPSTFTTERGYLGNELITREQPKSSVTFTNAPQYGSSTTSTVFQTQTGTRTVEPTQIVTSNRIVESTNRGNIFQNVKSGNFTSQITQSRIVSSEGTVTGQKGLTNYSNNPYLEAYVESSKKY